MSHKAFWAVVMVAGLALVAMNVFETSAVEITSQEFADSSGTVADEAIGTAQLDQTNGIDISAPGFRIFSDSLVLSSVWCGYKLWDSSGTNPETTFVACPTITDASDTSNTFIFVVGHKMWKTTNIPTTSQHQRPLVGPIARPSDAWNGHQPTGGFYVQRYAHQYPYPGFWWFCARVTTPP